MGKAPTKFEKVLRVLLKDRLLRRAGCTESVKHEWRKGDHVAAGGRVRILAGDGFGVPWLFD